MITIRDIQLISLMIFSHEIMFAEVDSENDGYHNQIVAIEEFDTPSSTKIMVTFEQPNPVCVYSPETFEESLDDTIYRALMPRTDVACNVICGYSDDDQLNDSDSFDCDCDDDGVEIILHGKSIQKIIAGNHVIFVVKK